VKHSAIHITDYNMGDNPRFEHVFSIWDKLTHQYHIIGLIYNAEKKLLIVPRGLDIFYLENTFGINAELDTDHDPMEVLDTIRVKYKPRDTVQISAINFMIGSEKYRANASKSQLSVNLSTGKGKSYCSIVTSAIMKLRTMIITSSVGWLEQWRDYIVEYTDTLPKEIYMLVGSSTIHRLLKSDISKYKYILASHATLKSYASKYGWDAVTELFKYTKIGIKIYDEAHLNFENMTYIDAHTNTYKTFYVTATPARSDGDENIIYKYYFKNVPSVNLFDADDDPHTHYVSLHYNSKPTVQDISGCSNVYGFDKNSYSKYVVRQPSFYKLLHVVIELGMRNPGKVILYIATNDAIKIIYDWMHYNYPELNGNIGIYTSIIKENKEKQLENKFILSTTSSLGAAMDVDGLHMVVVLAEPFKSPVITKQSMGRTRAYDTFYIEIVDRGFQTIRKYFQSKLPIYEKYALSVSKIDISDKELDDRVNGIMINRHGELYQPFTIYNNIKSYDTENLRCPFTIVN